MLFSKTFVPVAAAFLSLASATPIADSNGEVLSKRGLSFNNLFFIILENTDFSAAIADPNLSAFASSGVLFSNWDAVSHPSQPNYIALTSGSTNGITNDNTKTIKVQNIVDLLEAANLTWKSYQENYPGNCFTGASSNNLYFRFVIHSHLR